MFTLIIVIPFMGFILYPVIYYLVTDKQIMLYPLYAPYIDDSTLHGYLIYYAVHTFWCLQSVVGLIGSDLLMALLLLHILPLVDIFELSVSEMNEVLVNLKLSRLRESSPMLKVQLRNIIWMHKEITE